MAITYLKEYIDSILHDKKVILLGDLNDLLTDFLKIMYLILLLMIQQIIYL